MEVTIDVKGVTEVNKLLGSLPSKLQTKVLKAAYRKASAPLIAAIRNNINDFDRTVRRYSGGKVVATYYPGNLKKSIGIITPKGNKPYLLVGPRAGKKYKYDGYYGHMVENGTKHSAAKPFMKPAYDSTKDVVKKSVALDVKDAIRKFVK